MTAANRYYRLLEQIQAALSHYQYARALHLSYESLPLVPEVVSESIRDYGSFDLTSIPCIEIAARFSSAQGDCARLEQLRTWAAHMPELNPWLAVIDRRIEAAKVQPRILELVRERPGQLQSALPRLLGVTGRITGRLVVDMEYLGLVERVPSGKSYALYLPGSRPAEATAQPASIEIKRHTTAVVDPSDTWIAVDFETASGDSHSACSLGVAVVQRGAIISSGAWLIQPPGNRYDPRNTAIHGIGPRMTKRSPTYAQLYPSIEPFLESRYVLAHWAEFDIAVLRALHSYYGIQLPNARYACSCRMAQKAFPALRNHRLPTVCEHCGIDLRHHDATSDAAASAQIALRCRDAVGAATVHEAIRTLGLRVLSV